MHEAKIEQTDTEQEGFLVLSGECIAIVEGEERRLGAWDYCTARRGPATSR